MKKTLKVEETRRNMRGDKGLSTKPVRSTIKKTGSGRQETARRKNVRGRQASQKRAREEGRPEKSVTSLRTEKGTKSSDGSGGSSETGDKVGLVVKEEN